MTPDKQATYRAALGRLADIERRHRLQKSDGERELYGMARWVLDQWSDGWKTFLALPDDPKLN